LGLLNLAGEGPERHLAAHGDIDVRKERDDDDDEDRWELTGVAGGTGEGSGGVKSVESRNPIKSEPA
jgi:hypothetical protein